MPSARAVMSRKQIGQTMMFRKVVLFTVSLEKIRYGFQLTEYPVRIVVPQALR